MIAVWIAYSMLVSALVALAGVALESMLHAIRRPVRFVWAGVMGTALVLFALAPLRRPVAARPIALPAATTIQVAPVDAYPSLMMTVQNIVRRTLDIIATPVESITSRIARNAGRSEFVVLTVWVAASTAALLLLAAVYVRYSHRRNAWPTVKLFGASVRVAPNVGPAVMGIAPPEIVIPEWVLSRNRAEQQLVIAHEREHVRAGDPFLLLAGCIAIAIMPWNAALWFMWSRLRLSVELDCDMRVLQSGARKPAYGNLLLELSEQRSLLSPIMPAFAFGTSHLEQRLIAMTSVPTRYRVVRTIASGAVGALAFLAACQSELPTATQVEAMDVNAVQNKLKLAAEAQYTVDGKAVSKSEATAISGEKIASISVVNAVKGKQLAQVNIMMKRDREAVLRAAALDSGSVLRAAALDSGSMLHADTLVLRSGTRMLKLPGDSIQMRVRSRNLRDSVRVVAGTPLNGAGESATTAPLGTRIRMRGEPSSVSLDAANKPLVFVDGVERAGIDDLQPATINSIEVLKGATAVKLYGDRAQYGVINITLKK